MIRNIWCRVFFVLFLSCIRRLFNVGVGARNVPPLDVIHVRPTNKVLVVVPALRARTVSTAVAVDWFGVDLLLVGWSYDVGVVETKRTRERIRW